MDFNMLFMMLLLTMYYNFNNFVMLTNHSFNLLSKIEKRKRLQSKTSKEALTCKVTTDNETKRET